MNNIKKRVDRLESTANLARQSAITVTRRIISPGNPDDCSRVLVRGPGIQRKLNRSSDETSDQFKARVEHMVAQETGQ